MKPSGLNISKAAVAAAGSEAADSDLADIITVDIYYVHDTLTTEFGLCRAEREDCEHDCRRAHHVVID